MEPGNWTELFSAVASLVPSVIAIVIAMKANSQARDAADRAEWLEHERRQREDQRNAELDASEAARQVQERQRVRREEEREQRELATALQAWWVKNGPGDWGVLLSNGPASSTVFHDVVVEATGHQFAGPDKPIKVETVPPGDYYVHATSEQERDAARRTHKPWSAWELPAPVSATKRPEPVMRGDKYAVTAIEYTDPLGKRWRWAPSTGPRRVAAAH